MTGEAGEWASGPNRWWISTSGDDPRFAELASAHESHHRQLGASTTFGGLTTAMQDLGDKVSPGLASALVSVSRQTQEAFATWTPAFALGWSRERLAHAYPGYLRHYDAVGAVVETAPGAYLKLHAAHVAARVCMQSPSVEIALNLGLTRLQLADLRIRWHPDRRFAVLRSAEVNLAEVVPVGSFHVAVEPWCAGFDADVVDAGVEEVPVEGGVEF